MGRAAAPSASFPLGHHLCTGADERRDFVPVPRALHPPSPKYHAAPGGRWPLATVQRKGSECHMVSGSQDTVPVQPKPGHAPSVQLWKSTRARARRGNPLPAAGSTPPRRSARVRVRWREHTGWPTDRMFWKRHNHRETKGSAAAEAVGWGDRLGSVGRECSPSWGRRWLHTACVAQNPWLTPPSLQLVQPAWLSKHPVQPWTLWAPGFGAGTQDTAPKSTPGSGSPRGQDHRCSCISALEPGPLDSAPAAASGRRGWGLATAAATRLSPRVCKTANGETSSGSQAPELRGRGTSVHHYQTRPRTGWPSRGWRGSTDVRASHAGRS